MSDNKIFKEFANKLERYCDYQERCSFDVNKKLREISCPENIHDDIIDYLIEFKFLDDLRYCKSFVSGKFNYKRWGRKKIYAALRAKRIDSSIISIALSEIEEDEYYETLMYICDIKLRNLGSLKLDNNKKKLLNFALQRGFESNLIWQYINEHKEL